MIHALLVLAPLCFPAPAQKKDPPPPPGTSKTYPDLGLTLTVPAEFTELREQPTAGSNQLRQRWSAKLGSVSLQIDLWAIALDATFDFKEPEEVMDMLLYNARDVKGADPSFSFEDQRIVPGNFGVCPYVSLARGAMHDGEGTQEIGTRFFLGGLLEKFAYTVEVIATPVPALDATKDIVKFLETGITYKGPVRNAKWSEAEAKERWARDVPDKLVKELEQVVRTEHYIILTNSGGRGAGEKFGEQMEKNFKAIQAVFPFADTPGRKLLPIFLFTNSDDYYEFFAKQFKSTVEEASKSKGVAYKDWYATYFEAKNDPVHIHEGTHQIFRNLLRLSGGGSWFQEGVAEYMASSKNDRNVAASAVKKGRQTPLIDFIKIRSLLFSAKDDVKGGGEAARHYDLAGLEKQWVEYCKKR